MSPGVAGGRCATCPSSDPHHIALVESSLEIVSVVIVEFGVAAFRAPAQ